MSLNTLSPDAIPHAIDELNEWRLELTNLVRCQAGFAFAWAEKNGGVPTTDEAIQTFYADFAARFPNDAAVNQKRAINLLRERYETWAADAGVTTCTEQDFERFDEETNALHEVLFSDQVALVERISERCEDLSRAAISLKCDDVTVTLLRSMGAKMLDVDQGRFVLSTPATWTEAYCEAGDLLRNEAIQGVPLNHAALDVALDRLRLAAATPPAATSVTPATAAEVTAAAPGFSKKQAKPDPAEYSDALSKAEMMSRLKLKPRAFETFCKSHPLKQLSKQLFQMRLDGMDTRTRNLILGKKS